MNRTFLFVIFMSMFQAMISSGNTLILAGMWSLLKTKESSF
ncbi:hypothetical protein [Maribellus luteus]|nr:hypothetical protein [Maribellus luteus]